MRSSPIPSRRTLLLLGLAVLAACLVLSEPTPASATPAMDCRVATSWGQRRNCTFLEQYGKCLTSAFSSYDDCLRYSRRRSGLRRLGRRTACEIGIQVDIFACHLGLPYYLYQQIRNV